MRIDLTKNDVHLLLVCVRGAIDYSKNKQLIADAKAMEPRLEELLPLPPPKPKSKRMRYGEAKELAMVAIREMPERFTPRDVWTCLEKLNAPVNRASLYQIIQSLPSIEVTRRSGGGVLI